jgi:hypothetical protein
MKKLLLLVVSNLLFFASFSQEYNTIFKEDFNDNLNKWKLYDSPSARTTVNTGIFILEHKRNDGAWSSTVPVDLDPASNFVIDSKVTKVFGVNNYGYGLTWGGKNSGNLYVFLITANGYFQIGKTVNGRYENIVDWTESSAINRNNAQNILRIEKNGNQMFFSINGRRVTNLDAMPFMGKNIGFFVNKNMKIRASWLVVKSDETAKSFEVQSYPPDLVIENLELIDPSKNGSLDGNEEAQISFKLLNRGRGKAFGININATPLSSAENLTLGKVETIAELSSQSFRNVTIPISANYMVKNLERNIRIDVSEFYGNDAAPSVINFYTSEYSKPDLDIKQVAINDKTDEYQRGDAYGNGNSIIEAGESIEVTAYLQNFGQGNSENTQVELILETTDKNITFPDNGKIIEIGTIASGDYKEIAFYFYTSRRYTVKDIPIFVKVTSSHSPNSEQIPLNLKLGERTENIVDVDIKKIDTDNDVVVKRIEGIIEPTDVEQDIPETRTDGSNTLCVILGVEKYKYAPNVDFAANDARTFYLYAQKVLGIPEKNIFFRINENATSGEFEKVFSDNGWLSRRIVNGETDIIVYYAGHGAPDSKEKVAYLIPHDIDPNYANTGYSLDKLYAALSNFKAKNVTVFLDACFSGTTRNNEVLLAGVRGIVVKPKESATFADNLITISASSDDEFSSSYPDKYHGLFTYYLLKALKGDASKGKPLDVRTLFAYLEKYVPVQAGYLDRDQHPTIRGKKTDRILVEY